MLSKINSNKRVKKKRSRMSSSFLTILWALYDNSGTLSTTDAQRCKT